jgi:transposase
MEQATTIGLDIAKHVFQVHGADGAGHVLFSQAPHSREASRFPRRANPMRRRDGSLCRRALLGA